MIFVPFVENVDAERKRWGRRMEWSMLLMKMLLVSDAGVEEEGNEPV